MIYSWYNLAASILFLFTANALAPNFSLRFPLPFDIKVTKEFYLSDGVDFRQSNNNATILNFCFEKALSLAGLGYWCSIQGDAYGNGYGSGSGLHAYAYNYETKTLHPTAVCQATEEQKWKEVPEYCYYGVCPLPWTYDACSYRYGIIRSIPTQPGKEVWMFLRPHPIMEVSFLLGCYSSICLLLYVILGIYSSVKKSISIHLKSKLFKKNGGLLLEQHIANSHGPGAGCTKIFTVEELVMEISVVKEKVLLQEGQIEWFINEIITLAHINHQNVIKFIGCCLETEAPTLVYEVAFNRTLYDYIHERKNGKVAMSHWDILMDIASESAAGLAYLHSSFIIHGNVKSSNILLTDYLAIVAGFEPPRLVPRNESQISTLVQRTQSRRTRYN